MGDDNDLLPSAYKAVANWRWAAWPDRGRAIPADGPTQGFLSPGKHGPYVFAAKADYHAEHYVSFSTTLIAAARPLADTPRKLVVFVGDRPEGRPYALEDAWVFDPRRVVNQATGAERNRVDSKRERDVPIYDVAAAANGIRLGDHLSGRRRLPGPTADDWRDATLRLFKGRGVKV